MDKLKSKFSSSKSKQKRLERAHTTTGGGRTNDEDSLRMSKQVQEEAYRFKRNTEQPVPVHVADDVEEMFYNGNGNATGSGRTTGTIRATDIYRTTEQLRGTALESLQEDQVLLSTRSTHSTASSTTSSSAGYGSGFHTTEVTIGEGTIGNVTSGEVEVLRVEVAEMKAEVQAIRREMMNEIHVTRYDVMKELTMLKGAITQLVTALQEKGDVGAHPLTGPADIPLAELSPQALAAVSRHTAVGVTSKATRDRLAAARMDTGTPPPAIVRASTRLTALAPVDDSALSVPLRQEQIDEMFPLIDCSSAIQLYAQKLEPASREWVFERVQEWLDSRFNVGSDTLLAMVGDGGCGKSTVAAGLVEHYNDHIVAVHFCQFDSKRKSSPRNVLLSLVNQLIASLPLFKNQLARLNLKYVLEETEPTVLATKILVEPLCALEEPMTGKVLLIDGLDQCHNLRDNRNELLEFLSTVLPELPKWVGVLISSKPSPVLAKKLSITSVLDFSATNIHYVNDTIFLVEDIISNLSPRDASAGKELLKQKSGGNFAYLEFTKQALSHPGMDEENNGHIPLEVLHDLPESLYEIYLEIFEDKFGQGRSRLWKKAQPVLELIVTAASGPYALVTENQVQDLLEYTRDDIRMIRRSFVDIIAVRDGAYRMECSSLYDWLVDKQRAEEQFYVNVATTLPVLRKLQRQATSGSGSANGNGKPSSSSNTRKGSSNYSTTDSYSGASSSEGSNSSYNHQQRTRSNNTSKVVIHAPTTLSNVKPVGILKKR